jgi:hypothetical protein
MADGVYQESGTHSGAVAWIVFAVPLALAVAFAALADASHGYSFVIGPLIAALAVGVVLQVRLKPPLRTLVSLSVVSALVELLAAAAIVLVALLFFGV